ncbi:hypothetical protein HJC23_007610 [Cyclotella cryptica]|uniref:Uncharacterized protein n=1 Tax=Cyclotella cryptica TaxID=29204 RepID=A0ABD3QQY7_9STRA
MGTRSTRGVTRGKDIKDTNPFMVTSNQSYGLALQALSPVHVPKEECRNINGSMSSDPSFLMPRESDRYGEGSSYSDSALSEVFRQKESDSMNKRRKHSIFAKPSYSNAPTAEPFTKKVSKEEVKEILSNYNHNPKQQNPLYATEANTFGLRKPSEASYTTARYGLSQKFSQSFNRTMYRDEGLNASMTKSKVHDQLTPQFI